MRRIGPPVLAIAVVFALATVPAGTAALTKKKCRVVVKVIHHRKKKVRVCHTVKPPPPPPPKAGNVVGGVSLGTSPGLAIVSVATGDGAVWVTTANASIVRIDPASLKVLATIDDPLQWEWPPNVAVGLGSAWVANAVPAINDGSPTGDLLRIDEATNTIVATIAVGRSPEGIAFAANAVWTANHRSDEPYGVAGSHTFSISRVDPGAGQESGRIAVEHRADTLDSWNNFCCGPQGIAAGFGSVWVGDAAANAVYRVDPQTNKIIETIPAPSGGATCGQLVADATAVWVASGCQNALIWRIDPTANTAAPGVTFPTGTTGALAAGLGSVWAVTENTLSRIDPATRHVVGRNTIAGASALAVGEGAVWVAAGSKLLKIQPL